MVQWLRGTNAGDVGVIPGQEIKIPHAIGQLNLQTTIGEPVHHSYWACTLSSPCFPRGEACAPQLEKVHIPQQRMRKIQHGQNALNNKGFPGGPLVETLPADLENMGLLPGPGGSHVLRGNLSPCTTATKSTCHNYWSVHITEPVLHNEAPPQWGAHTATSK